MTKLRTCLLLFRWKMNRMMWCWSVFGTKLSLDNWNDRISETNNLFSRTRLIFLVHTHFPAYFGSPLDLGHLEQLRLQYSPRSFPTASTHTRHTCTGWALFGNRFAVRIIRAPYNRGPDTRGSTVYLCVCICMYVYVCMYMCTEQHLKSLIHCTRLYTAYTYI